MPSTKDIVIPPITVERMILELEGSSPLICHRWSTKAKEQMLKKQMKKATSGKEAKDPEQDYQDSLYPLDNGDGYGFPAVGFKASAVGACRFVDDIAMTEARGAFHVVGELVAINGEPRMREDMVRLNGRTADIRYRGEFPLPWSADVTVDFNPNALSAEQIVNLFNIAGFGVGIGEWRPEKNGSYGRFHVGSKDEN